MDNKQPTTVEESKPTQLVVAADVDTKVSDDEAQRKTAVWVEIFYSSMFLLVGFILAIWGIIWLSGKGVTPGFSSREQNSYFAMAIVGVGLIFWGILATALAAAMQVKNKTNHKVSNALGIMNWFTLNPFSWSLIRQSNGYVSKKAQKKAAKKAAAANSDDSIDESADKAQEQQAAVQAIN